MGRKVVVSAPVVANVVAFAGVDSESPLCERLRALGCEPGEGALRACGCPSCAAKVAALDARKARFEAIERSQGVEEARKLWRNAVRDALSRSADATLAALQVSKVTPLAGGKGWVVLAGGRSETIYK